jgi:hypothetical protein
VSLLVERERYVGDDQDCQVVHLGRDGEGVDQTLYWAGVVWHISNLNLTIT